MKKLSVLGVLVLCFPWPDALRTTMVIYYQMRLEGSHKLRKMFHSDEEMTIKEPGKGNLSGGFFFFMGGISGNYKEGTEVKSVVNNVRFAWEIENSTYVITTLPLEKIRIKIVEKGEPTASFSLNKFAINNGVLEGGFFSPRKYDEVARILRNYYNPSETFARYLEYVVFTVKSEDWPVNINLPVNQSYGN